MTVYEIASKPANDKIKQIAMVEYRIGKKSGTNANMCLDVACFCRKNWTTKQKSAD
jgi:hypothetical protein